MKAWELFKALEDGKTIERNDKLIKITQISEPDGSVNFDVNITKFGKGDGKSTVWELITSPANFTILGGFEVSIMECESGWGSREEDVKFFDTKEQADKYIKNYNKGNVGATPSYYWRAEPKNYK